MMQISQKRIISTYIAIYIVIVFIVFGLYYFFMSQFKQDYTINYIEQFQTVINEEINNRISDDYQTFLSYINEDQLEDLNNKIEDNTLSLTPYKKFIEVNNDLFSYDSKEINLNQNYFSQYSFGFFDEYIYFYANNKVAVIDLYLYLSSYFSISEGSNVFLMSNQGEILIHFDKNENAKLLNNYISINTNSYFIDYFSKNKEVSLDVKMDEKNMILYFSPLSTYENIYLVQVYDSNVVFKGFNQFLMFFILLVAIFILLTTGLMAFLLRFINLRTVDIENRKLVYYYVKPYIVQINKKGKIKKVNYRIKEEVPKELNINHINDFRTIEDRFDFETIKRGKAFTVFYGEIPIRFIPLKLNNGYYLIGENVSEIETTNKELEYIAYYNEATKLPNYHRLIKDLNILTAEDSVEIIDHISIVGFNIKEFGNLKENFNIKVIKQLLYMVGKTITEKLKELNINIEVYNTQEEMFVFLLKNFNKEEVEKIAHEIMEEFKKPLEIVKNKIVLTINAGNNTITKVGSNNVEAYNDLLELIKLPDSKAGSLVHYDDEIRLFVTQRRTMESDLIKAIDKKEFVVYLQPQYNTAIGRIIGFEALVRWNNPKYLKRSPQEFIELAEENGLIVEIGKIIMHKTFEIAKAFEKYNVTISMNISPVQLLQQGFVDEFISAYNKNGLKRGSIAIEVTETFLMQSFELVNDKLNTIKKLGIEIHLDDFGTGYSSLPYLKEFSFDFIKIDREFIKHITTDKYHRAITNMIISLAKNLEIGIIAEGVEDEKQSQLLQKNGCNIIQGFLISTAVPMNKAIELIVEYNIDKTKSFEIKGGKK